jgi:Leucine Rich repeat
MTPDSIISEPGPGTTPPDRAGASGPLSPSRTSAPAGAVIVDPATHRQLSVLRRLIVAAYIVMIIALLAVSPFVLRDWRRNARHWRAAALLRGIGGTVDWNRKSESLLERGGTTAVRMSGSRRRGTSATWGAVAGPSASAQVTDNDLALLRDLIHVDTLDLTNCPRVTDKGLEVLADLPDLEILELGLGERSGPPVTDATVELLNKLTRLRCLSMSNSTITDERMSRLTRLKNLTVLDIEGTAITDATLRMLKQNFPNLESLMINGTSVSKEGIIRLRQTMPTLQIVQEMFDENTIYPGAPTPPPRP